jgi:DNA polymerase I-like protein with 3'-5' exonuclease and polymerase domains
MRAKAKTANFGIIYGISAFGLSQRLNIPVTEAKQLIDSYFESFPGVKSYMDECIRKQGIKNTLRQFSEEEDTYQTLTAEIPL